MIFFPEVGISCQCSIGVIMNKFWYWTLIHFYSKKWYFKYTNTPFSTILDLVGCIHELEVQHLINSDFFPPEVGIFCQCSIGVIMSKFWYWTLRHFYSRKWYFTSNNTPFSTILDLVGCIHALKVQHLINSDFLWFFPLKSVYPAS